MAEIDYRNQVTRLIERQLSDWDVAKHNYGALKACKLRSLRVGASSIVLQFNPELRSTLKKAGFLTRDPRMKERKKYGLKAARRAPQFSKR